MTQEFSRDRLQVLLAETLGWEKSGETIDQALAELGLQGSVALGQTELGKVLDHIGDVRGLPGIAARFVRRRLESSGTLPPATSHGGTKVEVALDRADDLVPSRRAVEDFARLESGDLVDLLAPSLGEDESRAAVLRAAESLGLGPAPWSRSEAMAIMDRLSNEQGLIGVVSRLGKARLRLSPLPQGRDRARTS